MVRLVSAIALLGFGFSLGCTDVGSDGDETAAEVETAEAAEELGARPDRVAILGNGFDSLRLPLLAAGWSGDTVVGGDFAGDQTLGHVELSTTQSEGALIASYDRHGALRWARQSGGSGEAHVAAITTDLLGNAYAVGNFTGTLTWDGEEHVSAGSYDFFVMKLDRQGNLRWLETFGTDRSESASSIAVDLAGNVTLGFAFQGPFDLGGGVRACDGCAPLVQSWSGVLWLDGRGRYRADRIIEAPSFSPSVATGILGDVWITTHFEGTLEIGDTTLVSAGQSDVLVAHYGPSRRLLSAQRFGSEGSDWPSGIAVRPGGGAALTGHLASPASMGGDVLPTVSPWGDLFVVALDAAGRHQWSRSVGGATSNLEGGIAVDLAGNVAIGGGIGGTADLGGGPIGSGGMLPGAFLLKLDRNGTFVASHAADPVDPGAPFGLVLSGFTDLSFDAFGHLHAGGFFAGPFGFEGTAAETFGFGVENTVLVQLAP
jgi:hypothetical protein